MMDVQITTTLITAATSIFTYFAGKASGTASNRKAHAASELSNLYAPLETILQKAELKGVDATFKDVSDILEKNSVLVHPVVLDEFRRISELKEVELKDLEELRIIVSSFFNWYRKALGYPYKANDISKKYTPTYTRNAKIYDGICGMVWIIWLISIPLSVSELMGSKAGDTVSVVLTLSMSTFLVGLVYIFMASADSYKKSR